MEKDGGRGGNTPPSSSSSSPTGSSTSIPSSLSVSSSQRLLHATPLIGVVTSIFSSTLWGMYPVLTRYVMLHEPGRPQSTSLLAVLQTADALLVGIYYIWSKMRVRKNESHDDSRSPEPVISSTSQGSINKLRTAFLYGLLCLARMTTNMQVSMNYISFHMTISCLSNVF